MYRPIMYECPGMVGRARWMGASGYAEAAVVLRLVETVCTQDIIIT